MDTSPEDIARPATHQLTPLKALGSFKMKAQRYLIIAPEQIANTIEPALPGHHREDHRQAQALASDLDEPQDSLDPEPKGPNILCQFNLPGQSGNQPLAIIKSPTPELDPTDLLTQREFEIVRLVAQGWANKQIAHVLKISQWTVSTHLRRIFLKLEVDTRAAMVYRCAIFL